MTGQEIIHIDESKYGSASPAWILEYSGEDAECFVSLADENVTTGKNGTSFVFDGNTFIYDVHLDAYPTEQGFAATYGTDL